MSAARPDTWMPIYWGDYAKDTGHLSAAQHGAYLMLIKHYWVSGSPLPDDDAQLWRVACADGLAHWRKLKPVVMAFFTLEDGLWHHGRIDVELGRAEQFSVQRSVAGKASAEARKRQRQGNDRSTPVASPLVTAGQRDTQREGQREAKKSQSQSQSPEEDAAAATRARAPGDDLKPPIGLDKRPDQALAAWNACAKDHGWPEAMFLNSTRRLGLIQRLDECGGLAGWIVALEQAAKAGFLKDSAGKPERWFDLDWIIKPSNFTRLMEGRYEQPRRQTEVRDQRSPEALGVDAAFARRSVRSG